MNRMLCQPLVLPDAHSFMPILQMTKPGLGKYAVAYPRLKSSLEESSFNPDPRLKQTFN